MYNYVDIVVITEERLVTGGLINDVKCDIERP